MEHENLKFTIVVPAKLLPPELAHIKATPTSQFLVGYRNILSQTKTGEVAWGLIKHSHFCAKAFVFEISESDAHNIQQIKKQGEFIEMTGSNYLLLTNEKQIIPVQTLTTDQLSSLLEEMGGVNKITINLIKNTFDSKSEFDKIAGQAVNGLGFKEPTHEISIADKVKVEFNAKALSGKALLQVPAVSKQTGNQIEGQFITIKVGNM